MNNIYTLTQQQSKERLRIALRANVPCMVTGQPAIGKSDIIRQLAEEEGLYFIDLRLAQLMPLDLSGFPKTVEVFTGKKDTEGNDLTTNVTEYIPMASFPTEEFEVPIGYKGFLLFLDELNSADKYTQAAAYRLLQDREIANVKLHPECRILAAGNRMSDNAIVHVMGSAIRSRLTHISMEVSSKEFLQYAETRVQQGTWDLLVYSFLEFAPEYINNFDPKVETETFSAPRTLEFLSKNIQAGLLDLGKDIYLPAIIGTIGEKAGTAFCGYLDIYNSLPTITAIESNPMNAVIPEEKGGKYALGAYLANHINKQNEQAIVDYLERIPEKDLLVVAYRMIITRYRNIVLNKKVQNSLGGIRHQINGTTP